MRQAAERVIEMCFESLPSGFFQGKTPHSGLAIGSKHGYTLSRTRVPVCTEGSFKSRFALE